MDALPSHQERLRLAATAGRDLFANLTADRWEIFVKTSLTRHVEVAANRPPKVTEVDEIGAAARTSRGDRTGFGAASGAGPDAARRAVDGALGSEVVSEFDPLPPTRLLGAATTASVRPPTPDGWAAHVSGELATALLGLSEGTLELRRSILQEGLFSWLLTTSDDFVANHHGITTSLLTEVQMRDRQAGVWREWFHIHDPEAFSAEAVAARIVNRTLLTRNRIATDSGLRDLILDPEVTAQLLASLAPLFLATPSDQDPLPGLLNPDGQLASPALTLVDDRANPTAPITGPCDGEGLPARRTLLLDGGVPRHRLASYRDAIVCGETPRGGALRLSYRDYPATGLANLLVDDSAGLHPARLLESADRALYLLRPLAPVMLDLDGDGYRIVASGVWLRGDEVRGWHPVVELQGSLSRLLRRIEAVGTDLAWFQTDRGCVGAPSLLVRRQPVVG
jgi:PmbA protein